MCNIHYGVHGWLFPKDKIKHSECFGCCVTHIIVPFNTQVGPVMVSDNGYVCEISPEAQERMKAAYNSAELRGGHAGKFTLEVPLMQPAKCGCDHCCKSPKCCKCKCDCKCIPCWECTFMRSRQYVGGSFIISDGHSEAAPCFSKLCVLGYVWAFLNAYCGGIWCDDICCPREPLHIKDSEIKVTGIALDRYKTKFVKPNEKGGLIVMGSPEDAVME